MKKKMRILFAICVSLALSVSSLPRTGQWVQEAFAQHEGHGSGAATKTAQTATSSPAQTAAEEAPVVEIPLDKQQLIGVKTALVQVKSTRQTIRTVGRIEYDEKKLATINVKFESWIEKLHVDYVGKQVRKGDPLAEIYSPELFATQQEFINLVKWKGRNSEVKDETINKMLSRDSDAIIEATKQRLRLWDISDEQIEAIAASGKPMRTLTIYSPISGHVIQKAAVQGMRVMPGEKLFDIVDLSTVWVVADIYEYELSLIHVGDTAKITMSYSPGKAYTAVIDYINPVLANETRTAKVRFSLPNSQGQLKPQMFANVEIKVSQGRRLVVPEDAIIDTGARQIVYVDKGEGIFEPRDVVVGLKADGMVEILKGLKAKERVATAATFLIDSEARLKGIVK